MTEKTSIDILKGAWQNPNPEADRECAEGLADILVNSGTDFGEKLATKSQDDRVAAMQALIEEVEARMFSTRH